MSDTREEHSTFSCDASVATRRSSATTNFSLSPKQTTTGGEGYSVPHSVFRRHSSPSPAPSPHGADKTNDSSTRSSLHQFCKKAETSIRTPPPSDDRTRTDRATLCPSRSIKNSSSPPSQRSTRACQGSIRRRSICRTASRYRMSLAMIATAGLCARTRLVRRA